MMLAFRLVTRHCHPSVSTLSHFVDLLQALQQMLVWPVPSTQLPKAFQIERCVHNQVISSIPSCLVLQRGTTTALVISGFGLSAFLFSTIAHIAFSGDTSSFLLLLALGTSFPMILGFFLVHPIPLPASELEHSTYVDGGGAAEAASAIVFEREDDSRTALLSQVGTADVEHSNSSPDPYSQSPADPSDHAESRSEQVELSPTRATFSVQSLHHPRQAEPNVSGLKMLATLQFWLLSTTMMLCAPPISCCIPSSL
jgi:hypothetical protein